MRYLIGIVVDLFKDHRLWLLLLPAFAVLFMLDAPVAKSLLFSLAGMMLVLGFAHLARRVLLPSLDLSEDIDKAEQGSIAAAMLVIATLGFYCVIMLGAVLWLRG